MHASTLIILATSALGAFAAPATCKNKGNVNYAGVKLVTCAQSSFQGVTIKEFPGVKNINECAKNCAVTAGCQRAVWDRKQGWCLIKGADLTGPLLSDDLYQTAEVVSSLQDGSVLNVCLGFNVGGPIPVVNDGIQYVPCLNSDYAADSVDIIGSVYSAKDCAAICAARPGGYNGVWVSEFNACHIKPSTSKEVVFRRGMTRLLVANIPASS